MTLHQEEMDNVTPLRAAVRDDKLITLPGVGVMFEGDYGMTEPFTKLPRDIYMDRRDRNFWLLAAAGVCVGVWVATISLFIWLLS